jgi:hypothetical protein
MGFSAISHHDHMAQMRREHELSLNLALQRDLETVLYWT